MLIAEKNIFNTNKSQLLLLEKGNWSFSAESCLNVACENFSVIRNTLNTHGSYTLSEYLNYIKPKHQSSCQSMGDLFDVIKRYIQPLLGESNARQAVNDIERSPVVLTANHHGVTYFAQDFQGSLLFSLDKFAGQESGTTVPVFSCGTVPLDNLTYPSGLLFYRVGDGDLEAVPRKLPVFSNKVRRQLVSNVQPFDREMVLRAHRSLAKLLNDSAIGASLAEAARWLLLKSYCASTVMNSQSYSQQAVILNNTIWKRLFSGRVSVPELVCLELEKISSELLVEDLTNTESLASFIMFDATLCENVFEELNGKRACWQTEKLLKRLHACLLNETKKPAAKGCGTMLFWGLNDRGRKVPLYLDTVTGNSKKLRGVDDRGNILELPFSPKSIIEGLNRNKLLPSLFTSFLVVSLARGVVCAGGYFQCEYLPAMQRGVVNALEKAGGYDGVARHVSNVTTDTYLSGMIAAMTRVNNDYLVPAGPIEILAAGGFKEDDIVQLQSITVKDAHVAALTETLQDLPLWTRQAPNWKTHLALNIAPLLENKVVIK